jgi:hypothetical protein
VTAAERATSTACSHNRTTACSTTQNGTCTTATRHGVNQAAADGKLAEFAPWRDRSEFYVAVDGERIVGTMRAIDDDYQHLPMAEPTSTLDGVDTSHLWGRWREAGGFVEAAHQGDSLALDLVRASFCDTIWKGDLRGFCFATLPDVIAETLELLAFPVALLGEPADCLGPPAQALSLTVADLNEHFAPVHRDWWAWLCASRPAQLAHHQRQQAA